MNDYFTFYVKHFEITTVYEMCYINKLALPCFAYISVHTLMCDGCHTFQFIDPFMFNDKSDVLFPSYHLLNQFFSAFSTRCACHWCPHKQQNRAGRFIRKNRNRNSEPLTNVIFPCRLFRYFNYTSPLKTYYRVGAIRTCMTVATLECSPS